MDKPTIAEILQENEYCKKVYGGESGVFYQFDEDQRFYELDFLPDLCLPTDFPDIGICLPTARDMIDANVDHIDVTNARIRVNPKSTTNIDVEGAELKRKFHLGIIYRTNVESSISPWRVGAKHYALHGLTYLKTVWDADLWPDKPVQKAESDDEYANKIRKWRGESEPLLPINISAVHPRNVMPDPHHIIPEFFIESHKKACFGVMNRYPHWKNPKNKDIDDDVDWVEWWDGEYKCFLIDDEPVLRIKSGLVKHKYGFIPYVPIESGLGNLSIDGDFSMRYVGGIRYMKDILIAESRAYSIADYILKSGAWPFYTITGGEEAKALTKIAHKYGQAEYIGPDTKIDKHSPDVPPDALRTWLGITSDYISAHAAPRSTRGLSEEGIRSGSHERLRLSEASLRFAHSIPAFRHGTARVLINCIKLFKNVIPGDIRLWSQTIGDEFDIIIKKDNLEEPFNCEVEFAPISDEDEYRRHDDLRMNIQMGLDTKRSARRKMPGVDPLAMEDEEIRDAVRTAIIPVIQQKATEDAGLALQQLRAAANAKTPQGQPVGGGQPMGGMTPSIPQPRPQEGSPQGIVQQRQAQTGPVYPGQGLGGGGPRHV